MIRYDSLFSGWVQFDRDEVRAASLSCHHTHGQCVRVVLKDTSVWCLPLKYKSDFGF